MAGAARPEGDPGGGPRGAAIVTGAAGGIGSALVAGLVGAGHQVVAADRDPAGLERLVESLSGTGGEIVPRGAPSAVHPVVGDVGDPAHHDELVDRARALGGPAVSVLNAGVVVPGWSWEQPLEQWEAHVQVNLWGVVHGVRAVVPAMIERGAGHVVAVASGAGLVATPAMAPYVATKHAVVGLMESLHHELARVGSPVRTSVVCPGNIATGMPDRSLEALGVDAGSLSEDVAPLAATVRAGVAAGADPSTVVGAVLEVLREPRFWVLPQPEVALGALDRVQRIVDGRDPVDLLG